MGLRRALSEDRDEILAWRNRPEIVALSSSGRAVTPEEHGRWYALALADPATLILIIEVDGVAAGLVRFDPIRPGEAEISIYLVEPFLGRGYGRVALRAACARAFEELRLDAVVANIQRRNFRSRRSFSQVGFQTCSSPTAGYVRLRLVMEGRRE